MKPINIDIVERNNFPLIFVTVVVMFDVVDVELIGRILASFLFHFWFHKPRNGFNFVARGRQRICIDENLFNDFFIQIFFDENSGKKDFLRG